MEYRRDVLAALFVVLLNFMFLSSAHAISRCGERQAMIDYLANRFKEIPHAMGLVSTRGVIELFVSKKGSWTMLMTMTSGRTCLMAAGESWEPIKAKFVDPET